jgi:hypothetical protein
LELNPILICIRMHKITFLITNKQKNQLKIQLLINCLAVSFEPLLKNMN